MQYLVPNIFKSMYNYHVDEKWNKSCISEKNVFYFMMSQLPHNDLTAVMSHLWGHCDADVWLHFDVNVTSYCDLTVGVVWGHCDVNVRSNCWLGIYQTSNFWCCLFSLWSTAGLSYGSLTVRPLHTSTWDNSTSTWH